MSMMVYDFKCPNCGYIYDDSPIGYDDEYGHQYDTTVHIPCGGCGCKLEVSTITTTKYIVKCLDKTEGKKDGVDKRRVGR